MQRRMQPLGSYLVIGLPLVGFVIATPAQHFGLGRIGHGLIGGHVHAVGQRFRVDVVLLHDVFEAPHQLINPAIEVEDFHALLNGHAADHPGDGDAQLGPIDVALLGELVGLGQQDVGQGHADDGDDYGASGRAVEQPLDDLVVLLVTKESVRQAPEGIQQHLGEAGFSFLQTDFLDEGTIRLNGRGSHRFLQARDEAVHQTTEEVTSFLLQVSGLHVKNLGPFVKGFGHGLGRFFVDIRHEFVVAREFRHRLFSFGHRVSHEGILGHDVLDGEIVDDDDRAVRAHRQGTEDGIHEVLGDGGFRPLIRDMHRLLRRVVGVVVGGELGTFTVTTFVILAFGHGRLLHGLGVGVGLGDDDGVGRGGSGRLDEMFHALQAGLNLGSLGSLALRHVALGFDALLHGFGHLVGSTLHESFGFFQFLGRSLGFVVGHDVFFGQGVGEVVVTDGAVDQTLQFFTATRAAHAAGILDDIAEAFNGFDVKVVRQGNVGVLREILLAEVGGTTTGAGVLVAARGALVVSDGEGVGLDGGTIFLHFRLGSRFLAFRIGLEGNVFLLLLRLGFGLGSGFGFRLGFRGSRGSDGVFTALHFHTFRQGTSGTHSELSVEVVVGLPFTLGIGGHTQEAFVESVGIDAIGLLHQQFRADFLIENVRETDVNVPTGGRHMRPFHIRIVVATLVEHRNGFFRQDDILGRQIGRVQFVGQVRRPRQVNVILDPQGRSVLDELDAAAFAIHGVHQTVGTLHHDFLLGTIQIDFNVRGRRQHIFEVNLHGLGSLTTLLVEAVAVEAAAFRVLQGVVVVQGRKDDQRVGDFVQFTSFLHHVADFRQVEEVLHLLHDGVHGATDEDTASHGGGGAGVVDELGEGHTQTHHRGDGLHFAFVEVLLEALGQVRGQGLLGSAHNLFFEEFHGLFTKNEIEHEMSPLRCLFVVLLV